MNKNSNRWRRTGKAREISKDKSGMVVRTRTWEGEKKKNFGTEERKKKSTKNRYSKAMEITLPRRDRRGEQKPKDLYHG